MTMIIDLDAMVEQMAEAVVALNNATPKLPSKEDIAWALTDIAVQHCFGGPLPEAPKAPSDRLASLEAQNPEVIARWYKDHAVSYWWEENALYQRLRDKKNPTWKEKE